MNLIEGKRLKSSNINTGCNPQSLKVITDADKSVVIIQAELISAIGINTEKNYKSGKKTYLQLNTVTPSIFHFYISPEEVLIQLNDQL